jgi:hypothetical protein
MPKCLKILFVAVLNKKATHLAIAYPNHDNTIKHDNSIAVE